MCSNKILFAFFYLKWYTKYHIMKLSFVSLASKNCEKDGKLMTNTKPQTKMNGFEILRDKQTKELTLLLHNKNLIIRL